jgi:hypothetical protein
MHVTFPKYSTVVDSITLKIYGKNYNIKKLPIVQFLHPPVNSTLFDSNILLSNLFSSTL